MNYFSQEQQYNAWIISDLAKQIFLSEGHQETDTHIFESFAARKFGINIDYVFSIIMNIGDPENRTAHSTEDVLASYLFSLLPFITKEMIKASREDAKQYVKNAADYHLFLPDSVLRQSFF